LHDLRAFFRSKLALGEEGHLVWMLEDLGVLEPKGFQVFPTIQGDLWKTVSKGSKQVSPNFEKLVWKILFQQPCWC